MSTETAPTSSRTRWLLPIAIALLGALIGILAYSRLDTNSAASNDVAAKPRPTATTLAPAFSAKVYQTIRPSLVFVVAERDLPADGSEGGSSIGSGVIINKAGDILTANHVVKDARSIVVTFADGTETHAVIATAQPDDDIAVLHADQQPQVIVPAVVGSTRGLRVGDEAYAVGNPLGLNASLSAGVISGFDRSITIDPESGPLDGLIQFDAAVNPGSSGGPLLNRSGQVIGIVTALANPTDQNFFIGIGFAVPIATASGAAGGPPQ